MQTSAKTGERLAVELEKLVPSPLNPRKTFDEAKTRELAESIKSKGILQDLVVRNNGKPGTYEIVCGARRHRAAKLAGLAKVPVIVRKLTDNETLEAMAIENSQREDVTPLEEAAGFQTLLKLGKYDVPKLAEKVGKSREHIYARLQLLKLPDYVRESLDAGELTAEHAHLIGRLPKPEDQKRAFEFAFERMWIGEYADQVFGEDLPEENFAGQHEPSKILIPIRDFRVWIQRAIYRDLAAVEWDKADATILPKVGACSLCKLRTSYRPDLHGDQKKDCCLDGRCYEAKLTAHLKRKREEMEKAGERVARLSVRSDWELDKEAKKAGVLSSGNWKEVKANATGAQKGVVEDGPNRGKTVWMKRDTPAGSRPVDPKTGEKKPTPLKERRKVLDAKRNACACDLVREKLEKTELKELSSVRKHWEGTLVALVVIFGTERDYGDHSCMWLGSQWKGFAKLAPDKAGVFMSSALVLWKQVRAVLVGRLRYQNQQYVPVEDVKQICALLGWSYSTFAAQAEEDCPIPKAWAKLNEDGTPKAVAKIAGKPSVKIVGTASTANGSLKSAGKQAAPTKKATQKAATTKPRATQKKTKKEATKKAPKKKAAKKVAKKAKASKKKTTKKTKKRK